MDLLADWIEQEINKEEADDKRNLTEKQVESRFNQLCGLLELTSLLNSDSIFGKGDVIFLDFATLSPTILRSPLNRMQKLNLVMWVIMQNVRRPYFGNERLPIYKIAKKGKSQFPSGYSIKAEVVKRQDIVTKIEAMQIVFDTAIKRVVCTEEDVEIVGNALAVLEMSPILIRILQNSLRKSIARKDNWEEFLKEKMQTAEKETLNRSVRTTNNQTNINRSYRLTRRKIEEYYNLEMGKLERAFTLPEIIMVAKLMKSIELADYVIEDFVVKAEQTLTLRGTDVIAEYQELHDMLEFYKESNPELGNYIAQIDDCLLEMAALNEEDKEERKEWTMMIRENVETVLRLLPKDGKYVMTVTNNGVGVSN